MHPGPTDLVLLLVRHAATAWTQAGRYQGRKNPELSAEGRADAARLTQHLSPQPIGLVVSSPLARALETARPLAAATGAVLESDDRLIELAYGDWEGLTQAEVKPRWPEELRRWKRAPETAGPPGGESLAEAMTRLDDLLAGLPQRAVSCRTVALVTHDVMIRLALLAARGESPAGLRSLVVAPASAHPVLLRNGRLATLTKDHPAHA
jgi:probable phosphoglycerate mutase